MNKLIFSLFSSLFLLFIIWCIVAYANYGSDLIYYRIDFVKSFNNLNIDSDWASALSNFITSGENLQLRLSQADVYFYDFLNSFLSYDASWLGLILKVVVTGLSYISKVIYYIYTFIYYIVDLVKSIAVWGAYSLWIVIQLLGFVFKPSFVRVG